MILFILKILHMTGYLTIGTGLDITGKITNMAIKTIYKKIIRTTWQSSWRYLLTYNETPQPTILNQKVVIVICPTITKDELEFWDDVISVIELNKDVYQITCHHEDVAYNIAKVMYERNLVLEKQFDNVYDETNYLEEKSEMNLLLEE